MLLMNMLNKALRTMDGVFDGANRWILPLDESGEGNLEVDVPCTMDFQSCNGIDNEEVLRLV